MQPSASRITNPLALYPSSKLLGYYHSSALRTDKPTLCEKPSWSRLKVPPVASVAHDLTLMIPSAGTQALAEQPAVTSVAPLIPFDTSKMSSDIRKMSSDTRRMPDDKREMSPDICLMSDNKRRVSSDIRKMSLAIVKYRLTRDECRMTNEKCRLTFLVCH